MIEQGEVIEAAGDRARVRLPRNDSCRACGLCLFAGEGRGMILEAENPVGAGAGDRVEVELERRDPLAAAVLLFGLPLLAMLAGAGAGWGLAGRLGCPPDGGAVLLGALLTAGAFVLVRRREIRRKKSPGKGPRILRVLPRDQASAPGFS